MFIVAVNLYAVYIPQNTFFKGRVGFLYFFKLQMSALHNKNTGTGLPMFGPRCSVNRDITIKVPGS